MVSFPFNITNHEEVELFHQKESMWRLWRLSLRQESNNRMKPSCRTDCRSCVGHCSESRWESDFCRRRHPSLDHPLRKWRDRRRQSSVRSLGANASWSSSKSYYPQLSIFISYSNWTRSSLKTMRSLTHLKNPGKTSLIPASKLQGVLAYRKLFLSFPSPSYFQFMFEYGWKNCLQCFVRSSNFISSMFLSCNGWITSSFSPVGCRYTVLDNADFICDELRRENTFEIITGE